MHQPEPVPVVPAGEFVAAWIAYALHVLGLIFLWPTLIGLVVNYSKVDAPRGGLVNTHHRWLIRTFWWASLWSSLALVVVLVGLWPVVSDVAASAAAADGSYDEVVRSLSIQLSSVLTTLGTATLGALGWAAVWIWILYRLVRGGVRLAQGDAAPLAAR